MKIIEEKIIAGCAPKQFTSYLSHKENLLIYVLANNMYFYDFNTNQLIVQYLNSTEDINILKYYNREKILFANNSNEIFLNNKLFLNTNEILTAIAMENDILYYSTEDSIYENGKKIYTVNTLITYFDMTNGNMVISTIDGYVHIVNKKKKFKAHLDAISMFVLFDNMIFTVSHDCTGKIFNMDNYKMVRLFTYKTEMNSAYVQGDNFIAAGKNNTIYWNEDCYASPIRLYNSFFNGFVYKNKLIAHSETGGFYLYEENLKPFLGGHTGKIKSVQFNERGDFLTASADFTCRLFSKEEEIARPVIHGYNLVGCKFIGKKIAILSEETVIRILEPTNLIDGENEIMWATNSELSLTNEVHYEKINKKVNEHTLNTYYQYAEYRKIYAHYFSLKDLAISSKFIFSVNRSATPKYSGIFVFNKEFEKIDYVTQHRLDINKLIVRNDKYLLALSRDGNASLYLIGENGIKFLSLFTEQKRELIGGDINISGTALITLSRDNQLLLYSIKKLIGKIPFEQKISAVKFFTDDLLLICTDDGHLNILNMENKKIICTKKIHNRKISHIDIFKNKILTGGDDFLIKISKINIS